MDATSTIQGEGTPTPTGGDDMPAMAPAVMKSSPTALLATFRRVLQHYFNSTFQRTNNVFLLQQISISIKISQISAA